MASQRTELKPAPHRLTKYEKARIIGGRALQISLGAFPLVEVRLGDTHIDIARREFERGVLPIIIRRKRSDGTYVDIPLRDLLQESGGGK
ncbi:MAG: DNA-directed RNA polymerase subunit K [Candidatus Caldarchaeum sp.]|nr:DNA-directed RNA polymerase subunit K [Candidatus Caldarchaeum sp.]MDW8360148.1 DNA-directed RNA polymerase subunit K [Candidatus Caldarchaeum sp.]